MSQRVISLILSIAFAAPAAAAAGQQQVFSRLKDLQQENQTSLRSTEKHLRAELARSRHLIDGTSDPGTELRGQELIDIEADLQTLSRRYSELRLREEVYERLLFKVEKNYRGGPLRRFLQTQLLDLASKELLGEKPDRRLWRFFVYQSIALGDPAVSRDQLIDFIGSYMKFSSVSHAKKPQAYFNRSHYSDGVTFEAGHPMPRDQVGDFFEKNFRKQPKEIKHRQALNRLTSQSGGTGRASLRRFLKLNELADKD